MDHEGHIIQYGTVNYTIEQCPTLGRYLVATRDIKKGEIILTDSPLVTGPIKGSTLLCPGCYQTPTTNCRKCGWPVCGVECPGAKCHSQFECTVIREKHGFKEFQTDSEWHRFSSCLMIIRCLLLKKHDERKWKRLIEMEGNMGKWLGSPLHEEAKRVEEVIRNEYGLSSEEFPTNEIFTVQAILDINAYEVRLEDVSIQAAYKTASLAEHSCLPNTHKTICSKTLELTYRAASDIPKGSHISTTYCDILWPTWHRQKFLQWSKFFVCSCERCHSATECNSHLASFICMDCYYSQESEEEACIPYAMPIIPANGSWEDIVKDYRCSSCAEIIPARECKLISKNADDALSELDKYASFETISNYEAWLKEWTLVNHITTNSYISDETFDDGNKGTNTLCEEVDSSKKTNGKKTSASFLSPRLLLHPQHSLVLDACHTLFLLYPKEDCNLSELKRKESLGIHLLRATKPLFTGISKFRGTILYELAMTKAAILVYKLEQTGLTDDLQQLAEEVLQLLGESQEQLKYEPVDQAEGKLAQTGASQLEQLTLFFSELFS